MAFNFPLFTLVYFAGGLVCLGLAAVLWNRRPGAGIVPITLLLLAGGLWALTGAFEAGAVDLSTKIICTRVLYISVVSTGVFWLCFTLDFTGSTWWKRPCNLVLLSIIPLVTLVLAWTNDLHGWLWSRIYLTAGPLGFTSTWEHGPWFLVNPIYQYVLYAWGIFILVRSAVINPHVYRKQVIVLIIGIAIPVVGSILYVFRINVFDLNPARGYDFTPLYISVAAVVISVVVIRYQFLKLLTVAYKALVHSIPDGVLILNTGQSIIELNPAAAKIIGQSESSIQGKPLAGVWPELERIVAASPDFSHAELTGNDKAFPVYLDISAVTLRDNRRKVAGRLVMLRDINQLKIAQGQIEALYEEERKLRASLEDENKKRSQYTRSVVHELRTPLTSILASIELLEEQVKDPIQVKLVRNVQRSTFNLEKRVNELFELARGELGLIKLNPEEFDMTQMLHELSSEIGPVAAAKGLALRIDTSSAALPVLADRDRLRQVLNNLLSNALKFTPKGEIIMRAGVREKGFLTVEVADTGRGIEPEELENLFDPYRRQTNGGTTGLGIGLALSKIIVELHRGKISAESVAGKGATVRFTIPEKQ